MEILSVIIPNYNGFETLIKTLGVYEGYQFDKSKIKFIIYDDCSTDDSYIKLVEYAKNSSLFISVERNQSNFGPGITRNNAIKSVNSEYLTFMDSDDYFSEDFFDEIFSFLELNYECYIFDYVSENKGKKNYYGMFFANLPIGELDKNDAVVYTRGCPWGKIYKTDIIIRNNILFLDQKRYEDIPFTKSAIFYSNNVYHIAKHYYIYVDNANSLMHDKSLRNPKNAQNSFLYMSSKITDSEIVEALFLFDCLYSNAISNLYLMKKPKWKKMLLELEGQFPNCYNNKYLKYFSKKRRLLINFVKHRLYYILKFVRKFI